MKGFGNRSASDLIKSEFQQGHAGGVWKMKCYGKKPGGRISLKAVMKYRKKKLKT